MPIINPYLCFDGITEEVFNFYKSVFGGEFAMVMKFKDVPSDVPMPDASEADANRIMHISYPIGGNVLMGSDSPGHIKMNYGNNFNISVSVESKEEADRVFNGLSAGAKHIMMPMADAFWGSYFGMFTDKYGVQWMISYDPQRQ